MLNECEKQFYEIKNWQDVENLGSDPIKVCEDQIKLCEEFNLKGRIRVSDEGINGTLNGELEQLSKYMHHVDLLYGPIHWKTGDYLPNKNKEDQMFKDLSVKVTKEVVSLDLNKIETIQVKNVPGGVHLSPVEFHNILQDAMTNKNEKDIVLIDVRNIYETRIGSFTVPSDHVLKLDPFTRKFSEFSKYVDKNLDELKDKKVLMYCTGGVRCERASSYLKAKGVNDVSQLSGGIHTYQEQFPNGGFFKGKNFVYDPRIAIPSLESDEIIGKCILCSKPWDDYSVHVRCNICRMLVLVCEDCNLIEVDNTIEAPKILICEKCNLDTKLENLEKIKIDNADRLLFESIENSEHYNKMNAYELLEVDYLDDIKVIKASHKKLISNWHPNKFTSELEKSECNERLHIINCAFKILSDEHMRNKYKVYLDEKTEII